MIIKPHNFLYDMDIKYGTGREPIMLFDILENEYKRNKIDFYLNFFNFYIKLHFINMKKYLFHFFSFFLKMEVQILRKHMDVGEEGGGDLTIFTREKL